MMLPEGQAIRGLAPPSPTAPCPFSLSVPLWRGDGSSLYGKAMGSVVTAAFFTGWRVTRQKRRGAAWAVTCRAGGQSTPSMPGMSALTARFVANDLMAKLKSSLSATPASWVARIDVKAHLGRIGQTMDYLQDCYQKLPSVLPPSLSSSSEAAITTVLARLAASCNKTSETIAKILSTPSEANPIPNYYYSELRFAMKVTVPVAPKIMEEDMLLRFLAVEAVANLRREERSNLLAASTVPAVPAEDLQSIATVSSQCAVEAVSAMVQVFGEQVAMDELVRCVKDEKVVWEKAMQLSAPNPAPSRASSSGSFLLGEKVDDNASDEDSSIESCIAFPKNIFIISDCTGESARTTVQAALRQFENCFDRSSPADIKVFRFTTTDMIKEIVQIAKTEDALVVFTLVDPTVNATCVQCCEELEVDHHDLWTPLLQQLEGVLQIGRKGLSGQRAVDERYRHLVDCIEYTRNLDDGVDPKRWKEADVILIGPSRSGKTPLAFFAAQRGFKVANYPLVPDETPPQELWEFDQDRIFALSIDSKKLVGIRETRMETLNMGKGTNYAQMSKVQEELRWVQKLYQANPKWSVLDTTVAGIEENTAKILEKLEMLGFKSLYSNSDNPSAI